MGRRSFRRMWYVAVAFAPLPLISVGYAVASNIKFGAEVELFLPVPGAISDATRTASASNPAKISDVASKLFSATGKGPRADYFIVAASTPSPAQDDADTAKPDLRAHKPIITASLAGPTGFAKAIDDISRGSKGDLLETNTTQIALRVPERRNPQASLFMNASYSSPFNADFQVDAFRPDPRDIAYRPSEEALNFRYQGETQAEFEDRERRCLATAIYFEARGEPERGQVAVAQVILNRVRSPKFPHTICGVVYQGQMRKGCQFSFTCDGHSDTPRDKAQWARAQDLAKSFMSGEHWLPEVGYSTFYHANYVRPRWASRMNRIDKIGRHIFYKKRNEEPYTVEASLDDETEVAGANDETDEDTGYMLPTLSLASAVGAVTGSVNAVTGTVTDSVTAVAGTSASAPTQMMSLGYAASE